MSVEIDRSSVVSPGLARPLFQTNLQTADYLVGYVAAANGQRFLVNTPVEESASSPITVIVNWKPGEKR
jgi:hypothetical protein